MHTHIHILRKMADDVNQAIKTALNTISSTKELSGNMKKDLKHNI